MRRVMNITGPYITETVIDVRLTVESREMLDLSQYWNLDFDGTEMPNMTDPTLLYAKVAFPTVAAAQRQFRLEREALKARRGGA